MSVAVTLIVVYLSSRYIASENALTIHDCSSSLTKKYKRNLRAHLERNGRAASVHDNLYDCKYHFFAPEDIRITQHAPQTTRSTPGTPYSATSA